MKVVYIIGPFRGPNAWAIEQNIRRAEEAALEVIRLGAAALCPHTMYRFFQGAAPDDMWLKADIAMLRLCNAALLVGDYSRSLGSMEELRITNEELKIPVFRYPFNTPDLLTFCAWLKENPE